MSSRSNGLKSDKSVTPICGREQSKSLLSNKEKVGVGGGILYASQMITPQGRIYPGTPKKMQEGQIKETPGG